jgi:fructuronate reductase
MQELLSLATLSRLHGVARPRYDPEALSPGIVHIGCGAFHRAHQAVYTEQALAAAYGNWGIIGASLRQQSVSDLLRAQNGLYTALTKGQDETSVMVIGCVRDAIHTPSDPTLLPAIISAPEIRVVSLTITERGTACGRPMAPWIFRIPTYLMTYAIRIRLQVQSAPCSRGCMRGASPMAGH